MRTWTFLFWNLGRNRLEERLGRIVTAHSVDVVALAECPNPDDVEAHLRRLVDERFWRDASAGSNTEFLCRLNPDEVSRSFEARRMVGRLLWLDAAAILFVQAHLPDRRNFSREDQTLLAPDVAREIRQAEQEAGHTRTLLMGDLNMNPFDPGVAGANALNGVMTRSIAARRQRTVQHKDHPFFYNPMWACFGDRTSGPPGTYYHRGSSPSGFYWNVLDQALIRPSIMWSLVNVEVLDSEVSRRC